mgnify:FL=1
MMKNRQEIENKAHLLWGETLHNERITPVHCNQLEDIFKEKWTEALQGNLLEIGCGSGADLEVFSKNKKIHKITAIDLGDNIEKLSEKYKEKKDIYIKKGNALSLKFKSNEFDVVYSFGVFHHTPDPIKCISEAHRVLKSKGKLFLYLYSSHEDLLIKRIGIVIETAIMKLLRFIPFSFQRLICTILSPFCWFIFSVPSLTLKFLGFNVIAKKFPFYFGSHPFSLAYDLQDRLMSPINHRFSKLEMQRILKSFNFHLSEVVITSSGLYIYAEK